MLTTPILRQAVLLTADLESAEKHSEAVLGLPKPFRDTEGMSKIGFEHGVYGFDDTYLEICQPLDPESKLAISLSGTSGRGFMMVIQVGDLDALVERAAGLGIAPLFVKPHHANRISQWHPKNFGVLAEFDEMASVDDWHFTPEVYSARSTDVAAEISSMTLAVDEPSAYAARWAAVLDVAVGADGRSVPIGGRTVHFENAMDERGLTSVTLRAAEAVSEGQFEICGVRFNLTHATV